MKPTMFSVMLLSSVLLTSTLATAARPNNIVLLLTDDQDATVGGMAHMPHLKTLMQERGTTYQNFFVHTPICCPSRSSILSGRYLHNGGALDNHVTGNCYGDKWQQDVEQFTFGSLVSKLGYRTSYAGKYLNMYKCCRVPPGWDRWMGLIGNSVYYDYGVVQSLDGGKTQPQVIRHGQDYNHDYLPDLVANFTLDSIRNFTQDDQDSRPFLLVVSWPTAHGPFTPAPWAERKYKNAHVLKTPNYNETWESMQSKHWMMRDLAPIDVETQAWMDQVYQNRTEALLSVDNHISQFVQALEDAGVYNNTWIVYTSDNGWQLGQHRLSYDKRQLYENDIRVPFVVTGPGVPVNTTNDKIVLNIDIAPTFVDIATRGEAGNEVDVVKKVAHQMDGTSFLPTIFGRTDGKPIRKDFLISYHGAGIAQCGNFWKCPAPKPGDKWYHMGDWSNNTYHCVRTIRENENSIFCQFVDDENFVEYYDINHDPWQLNNSYQSLSLDQQSLYQQRLGELRNCKGPTCRQEQTTVKANVAM